MTIRKRLSLSFLVILALFALNLVIYFWGNQRRDTTVERLRRAISRQALISALNQNLNDIQKQVTLVTQITTDSAAAAADPAEIGRFGEQLKKIQTEIEELRGLAEPETLANINAFEEAYKKLGASWRVFYENFGANQAKAITELAVRAEPLTQEVIGKRLPQLQTDENARVEAASVNFYEVAQLTDRTTILIFSVSVVVAIGVAVSMSRQLTRGLSALKAGAASIGSGNLEGRIQTKGNDEFADLGRTFNEMTGRLQHARDQLTLAGEQERKKSEELEKALDQLRKAQDQLVVQQKLASLGSLTAGIAHEIKNPLNFVTNFAEISVSLVDEIRTSLAGQLAMLPERERTYIQDILDDLQQNVGKIEEHGKRADGIVRNMLMHSRGQASDRQTVNLNALVAEYVRLAYHGMRAQDASFNVTINEEYDPTVEPVSVVAHDLSRVFLNVATNACYAAYEKKKKSGAGFSPVIKASTKNTPDSIEVRIKDNGDGIPDDVKKRIFEPFFTTKPTGSGTGLGLSMSFEIVVQQHKGQIRVESVPGEYAEFIINIPKKS
jgi:signal transduction histidine kinase